MAYNWYLYLKFHLYSILDEIKLVYLWFSRRVINLVLDAKKLNFIFNYYPLYRIGRYY